MPDDYKSYLGDGLYVDFDGYQIELYASDGISKTNQVSLEPAVLEAFFRWLFLKFPELREHLDDIVVIKD